MSEDIRAQTLLQPPIGVDKKLSFMQKPRHVKARKIRRLVQPSNNASSYSPSGELHFDLPVGIPNTFMDRSETYLKFTVTGSSDAFGAAGNVALDSYADAFIDELTVRSGGFQVEHITQYNVYACNMYAMSESSLNSRHRSILQGKITNDTGNDDALRLNGEQVAVGNGNNFDAVRTYCIPLMSASVGSMADSYIPYMALSDLRLILRLANQNAPFASTRDDNISWSLSDVELSISLLELDSDAMGLVVAENDGDPNSWIIHGQSVSNYSFTRQAGELVVQRNLPFHFASMNGLLAIQRLTSNIDQILRYSIIDSALNEITEFSYIVGSQRYPQTPVDCTDSPASEPFYELLKYLHKQSDHSTQVGFDSNRWAGTHDTDYATAENPSVFYMATDLDTVQGKGDVIYSGVNSLASDPQIRLQYGDAGSSAQIDVFAMHDALLVIQNGILRVAL